MSDISKMTDKQLRNEVQLLRDELAMMKRKYEDIIYNLDTDNFSSRFVKEQGDMKTAIKVTAKGLEAKVSNEEFQNKLSLTAEKFETSISNLDLTLSASILLNANAIATEVNNRTAADNELSTKITQSAETIKAEVKEELENGDFVNQATLDIKANEILSTVSQTYATTGYVSSEISQTAEEIRAEVSSVDEKADGLSESVSSVIQTADSISTKVSKITSGEFTDGSKDSEGNEQYYTLFTQDAEKFTFQGNYMDIQSAIRLTDNYGNHVFSIFHNEGGNVSNGQRGVYIGAAGTSLTDPLFLGSESQKVYLYDLGDDNLIATQGWVRDNAGSGGTVVARFG